MLAVMSADVRNYIQYVGWGCLLACKNAHVGEFCLPTTVPMHKQPADSVELYIIGTCQFSKLQNQNNLILISVNDEASLSAKKDIESFFLKVHPFHVYVETSFQVKEYIQKSNLIILIQAFRILRCILFLKFYIDKTF